jgi:hypothetical protein
MVCNNNPINSSKNGIGGIIGKRLSFSLFIKATAVLSNEKVEPAGW